MKIRKYWMILYQLLFWLTAEGMDTTTAAIGFNASPTDWVEIISEAGYIYLIRDMSHAFHVGLGAIFTF
ncbi:MAG: hypothetical protein GY854_24050 [Deltaproteobacteria bacterium]|nr:hypothetical protein [Deltaproteobacteria bacterium]